jgi:hypothetical protein
VSEGRNVRCCAGAEIDGYRTDAAGVVERVAAAPPVDDVGAVTDDVLESVVAVAAYERVRAGAAGKVVGVGIAGKGVIAARSRRRSLR